MIEYSSKHQNKKQEQLKKKSVREANNNLISTNIKDAWNYHMQHIVGNLSACQQMAACTWWYIFQSSQDHFYSFAITENEQSSQVIIVYKFKNVFFLKSFFFTLPKEMIISSAFSITITSSRFNKYYNLIIIKALIDK